MPSLRHLAPLLAAGLSCAGCDQGPATVSQDVPAPTPTQQAPAAEIDNSSIIRPAVQAETEAVPQTPAPPPTPTPVVKVVRFVSGSALDDQARATLDALLGTPALQDAAITLRGHSDTQGSDDENRITSRKRANAVRDYLVAHDVPAEAITTIALGETRPVAPNANPDGSDNEAGRARNRRVEIEVVPSAATLPAVPAPAAESET